MEAAQLKSDAYFNRNLPVCEDYELWLKIARHHPVGLDPIFSVTKFGGNGDQLSRRYPAMDRFRVETLFRLLQNESSPSFRQKIIPVLMKKLAILIKGYEKRGKREDVTQCREILTSIQRYDRTESAGRPIGEYQWKK